MYDRPSGQELIAAAIEHFETRVVPLTKAENQQIYFQTIVAINVLKIALRELENRPDHLRAEWDRLAQFLDLPAPATDNDDALAQHLAETNQQLAQRIRNGEFDENHALFQHLMQTTIEQLEVARPKHLTMLAAEADNAQDD